MKKLLCLFIALVSIQLGLAQNTITVVGDTAGYAQALDLSVTLDNADDIAALQFDVVFDPSALTVTGSAVLDPAINNHAIGSSQPESGRLRIVIFSLSGDVIAAGSQNLLTVPITTKYEPGNFNLSVENIVMSDALSAPLTGTGVTGVLLVEGPKYVLVSQNIDFGEVPMLSAPTQTMTVQNQGNTTLTLSAYSVNLPPYLTDQFPIDIPAFGSTQLTVALETTAKQIVSEQLSLTTNDPSALRGTQRATIFADIFAVNEISIGTGSGPINTNVSIPVTVDNMEPFNGFQFDVVLPQDISYVNGSVAYSGRETDHVVAASMINSNTLRILGYSNNNEDFTGNSGALLTFELLPLVSSGTYPLIIQNAILTHIDFGNIVSDVYSGQISISSPNLVVSPSSIDFGRVPINQIEQAQIDLTNNGSLDLLIDEVVYNDPALTSTITPPLTIAISETTQETITFTPASFGLFSSSVSIRHNGSTEQNVIPVTADVFSPNYLLIEERNAYPGQSVLVDLSGSFYEDIRGMQFDINIPGDFTFDFQNVIEEAALANFTVSSASLGNNDYRFIIYTLSNDLIANGTVPLLKLPIEVDPGAFGDYTLAISNVVLSNASNQNIASEALEEGVVHVVENLPPTAADQSVQTPEDTPVQITLIGADVYNDPLTYTIVTQPSNGTAVLTGNTVDYTPDANYNGPDSFTFTANDGTTDSNVATVSIDVTAVNDAPVASDQSVTTDEDTMIQITLVATDVDGDPLTYSIVTQPTNGTAVLTGNTVDYTPDANYNGPDSFTFTANDGTTDSNVATVSIDVTAVNDAPVASDQSVTTDEDTLIQITLSATDIEGDPLTYTIVTQPSNGTAVLTGNTVDYTPDANYNGPDSFTFTANDGTTDSNVATVSIDVTAVNDAPVASDQSVTTDEDTMIQITLVATDVDGDPLTYAIVTQPTNGTAVLTGNTVDYTPDANYNGPDSFTFTANDGTTDSNVATVSIDVTAVNDAPVASDQSVTTDEDTLIQITLSATDIEGDPLTYTIVTQPANGTAVLTGNTVDYTPDVDYNGPDSFTFTANDGTTDSNVATVSIDVTPVNDAPVASDQSVTTDEDTMIQITLVATDVDGDPLTYSIVTQPTNGTAVLTGNTVDYTPDANYNGPDSFTFTANDGTTDSNVATVSIDVTAVNDAPVASDQSVTTDEDTLIQITLSATDIEGDPLTYTIVTQPTNGTAVLTGNTVDYTPDANYNGPDSFTFTANDGTSDSNVAIVSIDVTPVNDAPVASDQSVTTDEDTMIQITLVATDVDGDPLTYAIVTQPTNGTAVLTGNTVDYTPDANYNGPDSFTFTANDGTTDSNVATVSIDVTAVNDAPVASDQSVTTDEDTLIQITLSATDIEGDPLTYTIVTQPANGTAVLTGNTVDYTPDVDYNGPDSFTFTANDGTTDSNVATVSIDVTPVNDAPVASDQSVTTDEDTMIQITLVATDVDGDPLTYAIVTQPTNGTAVLTGNTVDYTPDVNYNGPDSFTFTANDGTTDSNVATVSIDVTAVNDAPVASDQSVTTDEDTLIQITLSATDIEGDPLTYTIVTQPANGTAVLTGNTVDYTPDVDYNGPDSFTFTANDGTTDSNVATVSIDVTPVNDAPVASDQSVTTDEDTMIQITLVATDVDGDPLTYAIVTQPTNGTAVLTGNTVDYTPDANYNGPDSFTFTANDGTTDSNVATVSIDVTAVNDAPVASDQSVTTDEDTLIQITLSATDIEGDPLTYTIVTQPANGTAVLTGNTVDYTPDVDYNGPDSFTFTANDGTTDSNVATVSIDVTPVNDAPVASDQSVTTDEDTMIQITLVATDVDGDPLTYAIVTQPTNGTAVLTGNTVDYTPDVNYNGPDSFTFTANDGTTDSNVATVSIDVLLGLNEYRIPPKISPNPFNNRVFIELEFDANGQLFDISGKLVKSFKLNAGSNTVFLDNLSNGVYFMRLNNDYRTIVTRLIKE